MRLSDTLNMVIHEVPRNAQLYGELGKTDHLASLSFGKITNLM